MVCPPPIRWPIIMLALLVIVLYALMVLKTMSVYRPTDYQPGGKRGRGQVKEGYLLEIGTVIQTFLLVGTPQFHG